MKMKKLVSVLIMLTAVVLLSTQAIAETVTCVSTADVYIDQGSPTSNFNTKTRVLLSWHSTKGIARGLLKFDIPAALQALQITSAILHVSKNSTGGTGTIVNVSAYALNSAFDETTETWNTHSGGDYDTSVVSTGTLPVWTTEITQATIDVTTLLAGNLDKVRSFGMLMKVTTESGTNVNQNFASKEEVDVAPYFDPYVEITYTPTLITLSSFDAIPDSRKVTLAWTTESEIDNAGFNVYRAEASGEYVQINADIVPAQGSATSGSTYEFVDEDVQNRITYSYKLEDIDINGAATLHGPVSATPRLIYLFK